jgi:hypothetical protein
MQEKTRDVAEQALPLGNISIELQTAYNEEIMAKAKKTTPAAPKKKSAAPASSSDAPMIDTTHAAMAAAKMIKAKAALSSASGGAPMKESAAFKNLKESVNKPSSSMGNFLNDSAAPEHKKSNLPAFGGKQVGRNQTFGADVNRAGVPRRTGGG